MGFEEARTVIQIVVLSMFYKTEYNGIYSGYF